MRAPLVLRSKTASIVGLVIALGWPLLFLATPWQAHQNIANAGQDVGVLIAEWLAFAVIAAIVVFWERLPLFASVGLRRPRWADFGAMLLAFVALFILLALIGVLARASGASGVSFAGSADMKAIFAIPFALRLGVVLTAGFCEEFFFRGYAIERLTALTGKTWIGVVAAIVLFTLGHVARYGFTLGLLGVAVIATALSVLYAVRRNLWPCIAMHWIVDGLPLVVAPFFLHLH